MIRDKLMETKMTTAAVSQAVSEWARIFPKEATENYESSVTFIKQLTVIVVSTISYFKNVAPEDCYMMETFGGIKLKILKKTCRDEWGQFLSTTLLQAFDAFDKKYLHRLALCFYEDECKLENLVEYHIFEYTYNSDGVNSMNIHSKNRNSTKNTMRFSFENIADKTLQLIRACLVITQAYTTQFSRISNVSFRLYYNDDAPADYQAPGFVRTRDKDHLKPTIQDILRLGWVETPYHKIVAYSFYKVPSSSHEANPTENPPEQVLTNDMELSDTVEMSQPERDGGLNRHESVRLCCPCNMYGPCDNLTQSELLTCHYCKLQQHAACFGVVRHLTSRVTNHCCSKCYDDDTTRTPTDNKLVSLSMRKRESLCILRRTLELCSEVQTIGVRDLMDKFDISESNAANLMQLLHSNKIIQQYSQSNLTTRQKIMKDQLKILMSNFFHTTEDNIVDLLLTECFASQESVPDPISGALNPTGKISLQNASNKDRYVDNPEKRKGKRIEKRRIAIEDKEMIGRTGIKMKHNSLCILRRTLELCSEVQTIAARDLMDKFDISESNAANLMQLLHSNKIIQQYSQSNLTTRQKIMKDQLKILMSNFFHTTEDNIVDLLLTECFASQESVPGPISGALNPTGKISLQNASNKDRYVDNPEKRKGKRIEKRRIAIQDKEMIGRTGIQIKQARIVLTRLLIK